MYWMSHIRLTALGVATVLALIASHRYAESDLQDQALSAEDFDREMDREREQTAARIATKQSVARDVIDGRLSVADAVRHFLAVNEASALAVSYLRAGCPGQDDLERAAWQLVQYVRTTPDSRASEAASNMQCELTANPVRD